MEENEGNGRIERRIRTVKQKIMRGRPSVHNARNSAATDSDLTTPYRFHGLAAWIRRFSRLSSRKRSSARAGEGFCGSAGTGSRETRADT